MRYRTARKTGRPAAATVELAILLPLLAFLFVIGVDFARVYNPYLTITNAARNGAMYGSQDPDKAMDDAGITAEALADTTNLSPAPTVTTTRIYDAFNNVTHIDVTVTWTFNTITRFPGVPSTMNLRRTVRMRVTPESPKLPSGGAI